MGFLFGIQFELNTKTIDYEEANPVCGWLCDAGAAE
jgi:hypothetical protein